MRGLVRVVPEAFFRATSFAEVDERALDAEVLGVLAGFFGGQWGVAESSEVSVARLAAARSASVSIGGWVEQTITVTVPEDSCLALCEFLTLPSTSPKDVCQDVVDELANTVAGRLKVALADGLSTGLPSRPLPAPVSTYRRLFSREGALVEVSARD